MYDRLYWILKEFANGVANGSDIEHLIKATVMRIENKYILTERLDNL